MLIKQFFVKHKPGIIQKTDYILTDKLPYNQRKDRHNPVISYNDKDQGVQCKINKVTCTRTKPDIRVYQGIVWEVLFFLLKMFFEGCKDPGVKVRADQKRNPACNCDPDAQSKEAHPGVFQFKERSRAETCDHTYEEHEQNLGRKSDENGDMRFPLPIDFIDHVHDLSNKRIDENCRRSKERVKAEVKDNNTRGKDLGSRKVNHIESSEHGKTVFRHFFNNINRCISSNCKSDNPV